MLKQLTYLATPYNSKSKSVKQTRFGAVTQAAGILMNMGKIVFSPITHCHPISDRHELPGTWEFWKQFDEVYLGYSKEMYILTLEGWEESVGVTAETAIAIDLGIPVSLLVPTYDRNSRITGLDIVPLHFGAKE